MKLLSKREVKELVLYSPQHIARLEKADKFPKRVQIGPNRVGELCPKVGDAICLGGDFGYLNSVLKINPADDFGQARWGGELSPFFLS